MLGRKAQSTLEYVLVLTAIIGAIIVATTQFIKPRVESSMDHVTGQMETAVNKIQF